MPIELAVARDPAPAAVGTVQALAAPAPVPAIPAPGPLTASVASPTIVMQAPPPAADPAPSPPVQIALARPPSPLALAEPAPADPAPSPADAQALPPARIATSTAIDRSRIGSPGLVFIARRGDTLHAIYANIYQGLRPPPYEQVVAANPLPLRPGTMVVLPIPPDGWSRP